MTRNGNCYFLSVSRKKKDPVLAKWSRANKSARSLYGENMRKERERERRGGGILLCNHGQEKGIFFSLAHVALVPLTHKCINSGKTSPRPNLLSGNYAGSDAGSGWRKCGTFELLCESRLTLGKYLLIPGHEDITFQSRQHLVEKGAPDRLFTHPKIQLCLLLLLLLPPLARF